MNSVPYCIWIFGQFGWTYQWSVTSRHGAAGLGKTNFLRCRQTDTNCEKIDNVSSKGNFLSGWHRDRCIGTLTKSIIFAPWVTREEQSSEENPPQFLTSSM